MEKLYQLGYNDGKKIEEYLKSVAEFVWFFKKFIVLPYWI
jgi:hypothetical protein